MASRRARIEAGVLILVSIVLIVLLVLVSITFSKVNNPPPSGGNEGHSSLPTIPPVSRSSTEPPISIGTSPAVFLQNYDGTMGTGDTWSDDYCNKDSVSYKAAALKYAKLITQSLQDTYPGSVATINDLEPNTGTCASFAVKRSRTMRRADDETVMVDFTSHVVVHDGDTPPSPDTVQKTINSEIKCPTSCNVTSK